ncbi:hypothetical protein CBR_g39723 [Chara braunii]|uniref:S1 motif domain-containing protein n=1 Tax=Chara braunii TaxID=69332 RepID=A0A388LS43_CHABU|nr:hypothetical protein CBR_g39723 [Chara braunii]|eukprot:GBG85158.1 hypothetical protein CBR_g39723 [Chara braunii]
MAKVSDCICGLASSSSTSASSMAATCHSLGSRSGSGGLRAAAASLSNPRRQQTWGPREIRVFEECLSVADRKGAESVTRGVQTKPARLVSGVVETGPLRWGGGAKPAGTSVGCLRERWWDGEASVHVEGGGSLCAEIGWRRRDRRWPRRHGVLAAILVADSGAGGADGRRRSRETTMSHQRVFIFPRATEAARADMATVDSLEAEQEEPRRYQDEVKLGQEGVEGADGAYAVQEDGGEEEEEEEEEGGYMPQAGDEVMGVVVGIDERGVDINIGARKFGRLPVKEYVPPNLYACQLSVWHRTKSNDDMSSSEDDTSAATVASSSSTEEVSSVNGVASNDVAKGAMSAEAGAGAGAGEADSAGTQSSKPSAEMVIEAGMELPFVVLGETISGRPLLSARAFAERIAWERIQQLAEVREPVEVVALDWNRGGIVSNVEGIRAFCPIPHLVTGRTGANDLQSLLGTKLYVQVIEYDQQAKEVIVSEKRGKIQRPWHRGLLHISRISKMHVSQVEDVFSVGDRISAIVVSSEPSSGRIALRSSADGRTLQAAP